MKMTQLREHNCGVSAGLAQSMQDDLWHKSAGNTKVLCATECADKIWPLFATYIILFIWWFGCIDTKIFYTGGDMRELVENLSHGGQLRL
jgi:hypothetical protein